MDDETRVAVAEAILEHGSPRFTVAEGRMLDLLAEIAARGDLTAFSEACDAYATVFPKSRRVLEDRAPAILLNSYLCRQPGVDPSKSMGLPKADPEWAKRIKGALRSPLRLQSVVQDLLERVRGMSGPVRFTPSR